MKSEIRLVLCALSLTLVACSDTYTINRGYASISEAQEDIEKGWLPPVLPPSSHSIRDSHNLDHNVGGGTFSFDPKDLKVFAGKPFNGPKKTISQEEVKEWTGKGYQIGEYDDGDSIFIIAVHPSGEGRYWMELKP
jgi:hypothetical protein